MLKIESIPVDQLIPYAGNARKHDDKNVSDIAGSIAEYGFNDPIAINEKDNVIIEGHGRLLAAKKLGMKEVPVIKLGHMSEAQLKAYTLVHNRMAEKSEWDMDMLQMELGKLNEMDVSLDDMGFDTDELASLGINISPQDSHDNDEAKEQDDFVFTPPTDEDNPKPASYALIVELDTDEAMEDLMTELKERGLSVKVK